MYIYTHTSIKYAFLYMTPLTAYWPIDPCFEYWFRTKCLWLIYSNDVNKTLILTAEYQQMVLRDVETTLHTVIEVLQSDTSYF